MPPNSPPSSPSSTSPLAPSPSVRPARAATRRIESAQLLQGARELVIEHLGGEYHLRLTRNDKLILTK
ncbi:Hemin uptake protein HemP [Mizugakiibacter sediminis]|uniref:Hemin uptake protein HemP n=1 Tax=Mizugakiibacter sediminis TaxID=1475481 RepID=A0A0K8QJJ8_9GAMM|nr:hemin uptake protein HemP [Mizugakiibacter sediminis]GAP65110.1 Hemin uptake protein HemP [Mizugakiibacter sediminis]